MDTVGTLFISFFVFGMGFMSIVILASAWAWPTERLTEENLLFQIRAWLVLTILTIGMGSIRGFSEPAGVRGVLQLILILVSAGGVTFSLKPQNDRYKVWFATGISLLAFSFLVTTLVL